MEVEKRLDQKSRLGVVTEVDHQINCEISVFEGRKGKLVGFTRSCNSRGFRQTLFVT